MSYKLNFLQEADTAKLIQDAITRGKALMPVDGLKGFELQMSISFDVIGLEFWSKDHQILELKKANGDPGWAIEGADFVLIEREGTWAVFYRPDLLQFIKMYVIKTYADEPFHLIKRPKAKTAAVDIITKVPINDLLGIGITQIQKP